MVMEGPRAILNTFSAKESTWSQVKRRAFFQHLKLRAPQTVLQGENVNGDCSILRGQMIQQKKCLVHARMAPAQSTLKCLPPS